MWLIFKALYIRYYSTKTSNKSLYSEQCWARYFKQVIRYITSYFSQINHYKRKRITRERNYCYLKTKNRITRMPNNKYVKWMKWSLNTINYYYKHCTLIYTILMFLWDNVRDTYQILLIIVNIINPLWTPWQKNLHWLVFFFYFTHQTNINYLIY